MPQTPNNLDQMESDASQLRDDLEGLLNRDILSPEVQRRVIKAALHAKHLNEALTEAIAIDDQEHPEER